MSDPVPWLGKAIWIFGGVMAVVCAGALIWSFTRPPVIDGPMPPQPAPLAKPPSDAGRR